MHGLNQFRLSAKRFNYLFITVTLSLLLVLGTVQLLAAQGNSGEEEQWTTPLNISESGVAGDPQFFQTKNGSTYVLWQDELSGYFLSTNHAELTDPAGWSPPLAITVPFTSAVPVFQNISEDRVIAFWIGVFEVEDEDELEHALLQSTVTITDFAKFSAWSEPVKLADGVLDFEVLQNSDGRIHLGYLGQPTIDSSPAGLYTQFSDDQGASWSEPTALYESAYLRPGVVDSAQLSSAVAEGNGAHNVYFAWENPALEEVYVIKNLNDSWGDVVIVDQRDESDAEEAVGPGYIDVFAEGNKAFLVWRSGHSLSNCALYFTTTTIGGFDWNENREIPLDSPLCPGSFTLLGAEDNHSLLLTDDTVAAALYAFDGESWSRRQEQDSLKRFTHPSTYREISLGCLQPFMLDSRLVVVGCGTGALTDIWMMEQNLNNIDSWYSPPSPWSYPTATSQLNSSEMNILDFDLVSDSKGQFHLIFSQQDGEEIQYSRWEGTGWSTPVSIISSDAGEISSLDMSVATNDRLQVVWADKNQGVQFSQVAIDETVISENWSTPQQLSGVQDDTDFPAITNDNQGKIYVVYSVPLNEQRGIYLTISSDGGLTWETPVPLFDGMTAGWQNIGPAQIVVSNDGILSLLMSQRSTDNNGNMQTIALHYARTSANNAAAVSPQILTEGHIDWSSILMGVDGVIHRFYLMSDGANKVFAHDISPDQGESWTSGPRAANFYGNLDITVAEAGHLHLVQLNQDALEEWVFRDDRWVQNERWTIPIEATKVKLASSAGELMAAFTVPDIVGNSNGSSFQYTLRSLEPTEPSPELSLGLQPTGAVTNEIGISAPITITTEDDMMAEGIAEEAQTPSPTRSLADQPAAASAMPFVSPFINTSSQTMQLIGSVLPAVIAVILLLGIFYGIYQVVNSLTRKG